MKKNEVKTWGRVSFALSLAILSSTFLYALTPTKVPGELKDINATSKVWLSSVDTPVVFYTKDTNISKTLQATIKSVANQKEIGFLLKFENSLGVKKDANNSIDIKVSFSNEPISFAPNLSQNVGIKKECIITNDKTSKSIDEDKTILSKQTTTIINSETKYAYGIKNHQKYPLSLDDNATLSIDTYRNMLYIIKSIDNNQTQTNISFSIRYHDANKTTLYQTKWIDIGTSSPASNAPVLADINSAKDIFMQNCIACHRYDSDTTAPKGIAPMLTNVGGWANKEYLKDILLHPKKYQTKRYMQLEAEGKAMAMPSFEWLSDKEMDSLIYFLESLKQDTP